MPPDTQTETDSEAPDALDASAGAAKAVEPATPAPDGAAKERAKRERRDMPTRVFLRLADGNYKPVAGPFDGIVEAEAWIRDEGADGQTYWPLRGPAKAQRVNPRRLEEVEP